MTNLNPHFLAFLSVLTSLLLLAAARTLDYPISTLEFCPALFTHLVSAVGDLHFFDIWNNIQTNRTGQFALSFVENTLQKFQRTCLGF